jgi:hypothetical protein
MSATTSEGTGNGSAADIKSKIYNGTVKSENIDPSTVITSDVADGAVTTAKIADGAVTTAKIASGAVTVAKMGVFKSSEQTGTGSEQSISHGLGVTPGLVIVYPTDTSVATAGVYVVAEGTHTTSVVKVTVTTGKKYRVVAFV